MGQKDLVQKNLEYFPDVFADIINALLYQGEQMVDAEELKAAPTENLYMGEAGKVKNLFQDVSKYVMHDGKIEMQYSIENEMKAKRKTVLRKIGYDGAIYRQMYEAKEVYPVISIVLYWGGGTWKQPRKLFQLFGDEMPEKAKLYVDNIRLHVFEMRNLPKTVRERFHSDMRIVVDYLAEGENYIPTKQKIVHVEALLLMLAAISKDNRYQEMIPKMLREEKEKGEITMCELIDKYEKRGERRGERRGEKRGEKRGEEKMASLIEKLFALGREKEMQEVVKNIEYREQLYREFGIV